MGMIGVLMAFTDDGFLGVDLDEQEFEDLPSFVVAVDVDKAWHALSFVITGANALDLADGPTVLDPVLGGTEFGDDNGYGPARHLTPDQVQAVHAGLSSLSDDAARARFDPAALSAAGIYPTIWDEDADELWDEYLLPGLGAIRAFYADAAQAGHHVVLELQ